MKKINLLFAVLLLSLVHISASAMFGRMRSAFKPFATAAVHQLAAPKLAKFAVGAGALYAANNVRGVHALEEQKRGELPDAVKYPELHKFFAKHQCSEHVRRALEEYRGHLWQEKMHIYSYNDIPFVRKPIADFERVYNAWRMKRVFEQYNVTRLAVPDKCLCNVKNEWYVIAAMVSRGPKRAYSKKEIEEMMIVVDQARYLDWHSENIFRDEDGILTFVDTEEGSFARFSTKKQLLANQEHYFKSLWLDEGITREWLNDLLESEGKINRPCGWYQKKYDDPEIDFERVKKEFKPWQEEMAKQKSQQ